MPVSWSQEIFTETYRFAADAHKNQKVPGTDLPYIMHVTFVTMEVIAALDYHPEMDGNFAVQCALLHDTIEDNDTISPGHITALFGKKVTDGVAALTKDANLPKKEQMDDSLLRIKQQPKEIWLVKMADRIANLGTPPPHWDHNRTLAYYEEARKIHAQLHFASDYLGERLQEKILKYKEISID